MDERYVLARAIDRMPISADEFHELEAQSTDLGKEGSSHQILKFLLENPEHAFTTSEIHEAVELEITSLTKELVVLQQAGYVDHRSKYWKISDDKIGALVGMSHTFSSVQKSYPPEDKSDWDEYAVETSNRKHNPDSA